MIRFVDLFAGIGGTRIAFEEASNEVGVQSKCVLSSEIDRRACETYWLNFDELPQGDISKIEKIPDFEFLLAGFPCQPFSYAGKHEGFGDTRGTLFFQIERILRDKRPAAFLLENVRGLTTHDKTRTLKTILHSLQNLNYGVTYLLLNSSDFGVPQNRVRIYILGTLGTAPKKTFVSHVGAADSHKFKLNRHQTPLSNGVFKKKLVKDVLEENPPEKYRCSEKFVKMLSKKVGTNFEMLNGVRLIDYRNGKSFHSWELGVKEDCTSEEIEFMNTLLANRRKKVFGAHQDGKKLTLEQIRTFYNKPNLLEITGSLIKKGYLQVKDGKYNPVCGNMSFEIFKFLDPESISITLTSSDAHKLGVIQNNIPRHITPRECARLQGFPDSFKCHPMDSCAYRQFGNTVTVPVVREVVKDLLRNNAPIFEVCASISS